MNSISQTINFFRLLPICPVMEQTSEEPPRRVTPTEARAKLLRSLVSPPEQRLEAVDREKLEYLQISFLLELAEQP